MTEMNAETMKMLSLLIPIIVAIIFAPLTTLVTILVKWFWENPGFEYRVKSENYDDNNQYKTIKHKRRVRLKQLVYSGELCNTTKTEEKHYFIKLEYNGLTLLIEPNDFDDLPKRVKILIGKIPEQVL